jgi:beta-N-acetylhexosaminidase
MLALGTLALATSAIATVTTLSLDDKIGQLFIVPAAPLHHHVEHHLQDIRQLSPGGILFKQSPNPPALVDFIHRLGLDTLRCADAEWGLSMRVKEGVVRWPKNLTLGAIQDLSWLSRYGAAVGRECAAVGIDINFAPVLDTPDNPAIGMRSFGMLNRAEKGVVVMHTMQELGVAGAAKHYPGLQKSRIDPHHALPVLDALDLEPFLAMIRAGVKCIMTTHALFEGEIVTFSKKVVGDQIRGKWDYNGLIITDAMNMKALDDTPGENAVRAFEAGHDCLLYGDHLDEQVDDILKRQVPAAKAALKEAVQTGRISEERLNASVERILKAKSSPSHQKEVANPPSLLGAQGLKEQLFEEAITRVGSLPPQGAEVIEITQVTEEAQAQLRKLKASGKPYVVVLYTTPYALKDIGEHAHILIAYEDQPEAHAAVQKALSGNLIPKGVMPVRSGPAAE